MIEQLCAWLAATSLSLTLQSVSWAIPVIQTIHLLAIAAVLSSMGALGLRLLNLGPRRQTVHAVGTRLLPWMWRALIVLAITGALLIVAEPKRSLPNAAFQIKMLLLLGVMALSFYLQRAIALSDAASPRSPALPPAAAKVTGLIILIAWVSIVIAGRWIAYL